MNGDIDIDSQLLGTYQNTPISVSDYSPQVENASSTKGRSRASTPPTPELTSIGERIVDPNLVTLTILRGQLVGRPKRPTKRTKPLEKI